MVGKKRGLSGKPVPPKQLVMGSGGRASRRRQLLTSAEILVPARDLGWWVLNAASLVRSWVGDWGQRHPYVELRLELCAGDKLTPGTGPRRAVDTVPLRMPPREPPICVSHHLAQVPLPQHPRGQGYTALVVAAAVSEQHPELRRTWLPSCLCCVVLGKPLPSLSLRSLLVKWGSSRSCCEIG